MEFKIDIEKIKTTHNWVLKNKNYTLTKEQEDLLSNKFRTYEVVNIDPNKFYNFKEQKEIFVNLKNIQNKINKHKHDQSNAIFININLHLLLGMMAYENGLCHGYGGPAVFNVYVLDENELERVY